MDISTIVNIILCVLSFVLASISLIFVVITIRQNSKMIENATRPYIEIYFDYSQTTSPNGYFVLKNFGTSSAEIISLKYNDSIKNHPKAFADISAILDGFIGNFIAPGQKFIVPFKLYDFQGSNAIFDITYSSGKKIYKQHTEILVSNYGKLVKPRVVNDNMKSISFSLQEIVERLMWYHPVQALI